MNDIAQTYGTLALCFVYPETGLLKLLREIPEMERRLREAKLEALQREHVRLFTPAVAGGLPPYEMEYGKTEIFLKTQNLADVAGFYRAFGLDRAESSHERDDFISVELEFMQWLCLKEGRAREKADVENESLCRDAQKKFMKDHLGRWAAYFGDQVAKNSSHPFYQWAGRQLARFVETECRRLGVRPERMTDRSPEPPSTAEFECGNAETNG